MRGMVVGEVGRSSGSTVPWNYHCEYPRYFMFITHLAGNMGLADWCKVQLTDRDTCGERGRGGVKGEWGE